MNPRDNHLLPVFEALANPYRLRIVALLKGRRWYVSELARKLAISRPLLYMHLKKLEHAGLVVGHLELSDDGKAMKYYELTPFEFLVTPEAVAEAARAMVNEKAAENSTNEEEEE